MKKIICFLLILCLYIRCQKVSDTSINIPSIDGYVQKGPFTSGTQVLMYELKSNLSQTGKTFTTSITDNRGSFRITDIKLLSDYVLLSANGFYFNEVQGVLSASPLQLFALSDIKDASSINVNILTHLEKRRVEYLVSQGKDFQEAKKTAQSEILAVFGISGAQTRVSEKLDITNSGDDNAMLLAISVMLQGKLSVAELSELLSFIGTDMEKDGSLEAESIKKAILDNVLALDLKQIRQNLVTRYQNLGLSANIPDFEKYIIGYINLRVSLPTLVTTQATDLTASSFKSGGSVSNNGGAPILSKGVVWNTSPNPSVSLTTKTTDTTFNSNYLSSITGLSPKTKYYYRAYATNIKGTSYGNELEETTSDIDISTGLMAYYPFNGNANDESGNGNNGIVNGASLTTDRFGNTNSAYNFNGYNNYINIPNSPTICVQNKITISTWFYMDGGSCNPRIVEINENINSCGGYVFAVNGNSNSSRTIHAAGFGSCSYGIGFSPTNPISSLAWHHLAMSIDGINGKGEIYIDGTLIQSVTGPIIPTFSYNGNNLTLGNINSGRCDWWGGKIDEFRIYNRALTQQEVAFLATH